jgi:hypothetical protein
VYSFFSVGVCVRINTIVMLKSCIILNQEGQERICGNMSDSNSERKSFCSAEYLGPLANHQMGEVGGQNVQCHPST